MLGGAGASILRANLIIYHSITDILGQSTKLVYILSTVQEPCDLASLFQWNEVLKSIIQFPSKSHTLGWPSTSESMELLFENLPSLFLLDLTLGNRCT